MVQTNGRGLLFQSAIHDRMSAPRDWTLLCVPRRICLECLHVESCYGSN